MTTNDDLRNQIRPLVTATAEALGEGWKVEEQDTHTGLHIVNGDGASLFMRIIWNNDSRIEISGTYPKTQYSIYGFGNHEITVSRLKSAKAIAGDITRRLLPGYLKDLHALQERIAKNDARDNREAEIAATLEMTPGTLVKGNRTEYGWSLRGVGHFTVSTYQRETVDLKLDNLTPQEAYAALLALYEYRRSNA